VRSLQPSGGWTAVALAGVLALGSTVAAQTAPPPTSPPAPATPPVPATPPTTSSTTAPATSPTAPKYLSYTEFDAADPPATVAIKRAYNEAVQRYNQALYDYHVTLERHDRLVDVYNQSSDGAEKKKARDEAETLRARLAGLGRDVRARATGVDQAARRAAAAGVSLTR